MGTRLAGVSETNKPDAATATLDADGAPLADATADSSGPHRLLLIDGHSMAFRAFYALPVENFSTDTGQHTNAVYGFTSMLIKMIEQREPTHVAVAFDLDTPTFRTQEYAEYKGGRNKTPEEFHGQVDLIVKVMEAMQIPTVTLDGYEADDIIATLSTQAEVAGWDVMVVSGDRDAFQLITDKVTVLYPKKGISDIPPMDSAAVEAKYFVRPERYSDLAALVGETADNLPGVPGVGPKTAAKWINLYGGVDGILENLDSIGGKVGESLRANIDSVRRNRRLNHLLRDLELPVELENMVLQHPDRAAIEELFDALQFNTLRKRLFDLFGEEDAVRQTEVNAPAHHVVADAAALKEWLAESNQLNVALQLVTEAAEGGDDAVGLALVRHLHAAYVPLASLDAEAEQLLAHWLSDLDAPKIVHDFKYAYKVLSRRGFELLGVVDDTAISAYLIQPDRRSYELADLAQYHLKMSVTAPETAAGGQLELGLTEDDQAGPAVVQAFAALQLSEHFAGQLVERGANQLMGGLDLPLSLVLARMELAGIAMDAGALDRLMDDFTVTIDAASSAAFGIIGKEINLGSPKQLQAVLFEDLGLPKTKKIKTGYSTDADALNDLFAKTGNEFLVQLLAYRDATKLRQTVEGLRKTVADDGRIHTTYAQTVAATGRLSSINPNLQNIPVRSEAGRRIREAFIVGEGYETLLTADYSQIEMRIMAHLSGDEGLIQAFRAGEDLHRFVGAHIFGVAPEDVTSEMRAKVKAMSYGLVYGLSSFGLSKQLNISVDEARTLMKDYFARFGAVRDYLRGVVDQARVDGFTSTIEGRRRYLPDLASDNRQLREMAERAALNAPIQGSAADIIKKAMLGVAQELESQGLKSRMLLQVHDELVLEVAPGEREQVEQLVRAQMGGAADLSVPLDVSVGVGANWQEAGH
ncbi:DNA polymerase I [Arthrobacter sulfonylureivorans]|uniref:DNA polymerase I n=1 Tax=Arthrobacter sulfonylureivorans TaxID=2486855 RepID=UPI0039E5121B